MLDGGHLSLETSINDDVRQALVKLGHQLKDEPGGYGGYQLH